MRRWSTGMNDTVEQDGMVTRNGTGCNGTAAAAHAADLAPRGRLPRMAKAAAWRGRRTLPAWQPASHAAQKTASQFSQRTTAAAWMRGGVESHQCQKWPNVSTESDKFQKVTGASK